jgi:hypothetical protein
MINPNMVEIWSLSIGKIPSITVVNATPTPFISHTLPADSTTHIVPSILRLNNKEIVTIQLLNTVKTVVGDGTAIGNIITPTNTLYGQITNIEVLGTGDASLAITGYTGTDYKITISAYVPSNYIKKYTISFAYSNISQFSFLNTTLSSSSDPLSALSLNDALDAAENNDTPLADSIVWITNTDSNQTYLTIGNNYYFYFTTDDSAISADAFSAIKSNSSLLNNYTCIFGKLKSLDISGKTITISSIDSASLAITSDVTKNLTGLFGIAKSACANTILETFITGNTNS